MNGHAYDHETYEALAAGYALSALEPDDEMVFTAHLPTCEACLRATSEHVETLGHLAYHVASGPAPASILEGIRAGIATSGRSGDFPAPLPIEALRARRRDRSVRMMTAVLGAAAAVVLVVSLLFVNQSLNSKAQNAQRTSASLSSTVASLLVPGSRKVDLVGDGRRGVVIMNGRSVSLVMTGVPANNRRKSIYVLWEKTTTGEVSAVGAFDVSSQGIAVINQLRLKQTPDAISAFIVTLENGRTAPVRTNQRPVVQGTI